MYVPLTKMFPQDKKKKKGGEILQENINGQGFSMKTASELSECPVNVAAQVIGCKWKILILRNLLQRPWRFNELKRSLEGISQKRLTESLRALEADGIIDRKVFSAVPPRVVYSLSTKGRDLLPVFEAMAAWGKKFGNEHGA